MTKYPLSSAGYPKSFLPVSISMYVLVFLFVGPIGAARSQTVSLGDEVSRPIPGAGHDYVRSISETVSPSNGSLAIKIDLPAPPGRGITLPLAITYNSGEVHRFTSLVAGGGAVDAGGSASYLPTDRAQQGFGWSDTLPYATFSGYGVAVATGTYYGNLGFCPVTSSYNFYDMQGVSHQLGLGAIGVAEHNPSPNTTNQTGCARLPGGDSQYYFSQQDGGDDQVTAHMDSACNGNYYDVVYPLDCGGGEPAFTVTDLNGTVYSFPANSAGISIGYCCGAQTIPPTPGIIFPTTIEDRNGNTISFTVPNGEVAAQLPITDTAGRTVTETASAYQIGGLSFGVTRGTTGANFSIPNTEVYPVGTPSGGAYSWTCSANFNVSDSNSISTITAVALPNGQSYGFSYDPTFGLVNKITYPDGGWVSYTWGFPSNANTIADFDGANGSPQAGGGVASGACAYEYSNPVIVERQVGYFKGSSAAQTQTFQYTTTWDSTNIGTWDTKTTAVTTTDNVTGLSTLTQYTYGSTAAPVQVNAWGHLPSQIPVETQIKTYNWGNTTTPLQTVAKTWIDAFKMSSQMNTLNSGTSSEVVYCYQGSQDLVQELDEYDYGVSAPTLTQSNPTPTCGTPAPSRRTVYRYFNTTSPCMTVIYNSSGTRVAETDDYLDGGTAPCSSARAATGNPVAVVSGTHDETGFGSGVQAARGNPTSVVRWLNIGSSTITTTTYDETGQILKSVDACGNATCGDMSGTGHTTTYSYADNFASGFGTPSAATNAYLTSVTSPSPNGVPITTKYSYRFYDGQVASVTDPNNQTTNYAYIVPSTGSPDPLNRLGKITGPPDPNNGNQSAVTTFAYNDSPATSASPTTPSVTTTEALNTSGGLKSSIAIFDGMGHTVQSRMTSDPLGTDTVTTTYDGFGRIHSITSPERASSSTTDGSTTFAYDALGRKVTQTDADGNSQSWCYDNDGLGKCSGNASSKTVDAWVDHYDEAQHHSQMVTDSFGRLVAVMEPAPSTGAPTLETDYSYDALNNLVAVNQKGTAGETPRTRNFTYDSLSRLLCASNPENSSSACPTTATTSYTAGTVGYAYDANGNLSVKEDARGTTTSFTYDTLNRVMSRQYSDGTPGASFGYDGDNQSGAALSSFGLLSANSAGRLSFSSASGGPNGAVYSYDSMGRLVQENLFLPSTQNWGTLISAGYDLAGDRTSMTYPDGTSITNVYNNAAQLTSSFPSSSSSSPFVSSITYDTTGAPASATYGNGVTSAWQRNDRLQPCYAAAFLPSSVSAQSGVSQIMNREYFYASSQGSLCGTATANVGNISSVVDGVDASQTPSPYSQSFVYDALNRINQWTAGSMAGRAQQQTFNYDSFGNLNQTNDNPPTNGTPDPLTYPAVYNSTSWPYAANNRLLTSSFKCLPLSAGQTPQGTPGQVAAYDAAGNVLCSGVNGSNAQAFVWDAESRISQLWSEQNNNTYNEQSVYTYDADGTRVRADQMKAGTQANTYVTNTFREYATFGGQVMAEKDQTGVWTNYVYANGEKIASTRKFDRRIQFTGDAINAGGQIFMNMAVPAVAIVSGDQLCWDQYNGTTVGGIALSFSNGTWTGWGPHANDGQDTNQDFINGGWFYRCFSLSNYAGTTLTNFAFAKDQYTPAGPWSILFADISLIHADGTVVTIYNDETAASFSAGSPAQPNYDTNVSIGVVTATIGSDSIVSSSANSATTRDTHYFLADQVGTTQLEMSAGGWPLWQGDFAPFGQELDTGMTAMRYKFTGKERDAESALDYFGARYLASSMGRWMSPDWSVKAEPIPYSKLDNPQSLNLYSYVENNPLRSIDLDGHASCSDAPVLCHFITVAVSNGVEAGSALQLAQSAQQQSAPDNTLLAQNNTPAPPQGRTNSPAQGQTPDSTLVIPSPDGGTTTRRFGPNGKAVVDIDQGHGGPEHGGAPDPHAHDWDWGKPRPRQTPGRALTPEEQASLKRGVAAGAAAVGTGYIIYRIIRFLPSLAPPLWPTIPANAIIP